MHLSDVILPVFKWTSVALLSAAAPYLIERVYSQVKYRHGRATGEWLSQYEGIDEEPITWITERVTISVVHGRLVLKNSQSSHSYYYRGKGEILKEGYLIGSWKSTARDATAGGCFIFTIEPQGRYMWGYWVGPKRDGSRRYGKWAVARDEDGLKNAKGMLDEQRITIRQ